ncbi:MAG: hypothetical protein JWN44_332 [Myxococcales bacterium]|nr:hypothetical protein [Myxococcales bacterium]
MAAFASALALASALATWPHQELVRLAPLAAMADIACIESNPDGTMKQVTVLAWVPAPAAIVREVIAQSERYHEFMPNLTRSSREPLGDGRWRSRWKIELPVSSFEGTNVYSLEHTDAGDAVLLRGDGDARYRYEPLAVGDGTLLVQYGYTDVKGSNAFVRSFIKRQQMMEHGLALSAQMMFVTAIRAEAVRRAGGARAAGVGGAAGGRPSFDALLARGQVAMMRTGAGGSLGEVSVIDRLFASEARVIEVIARAGDYAGYVPGVEHSYRKGDGFLIEMSLPIVTWVTTFVLRVEAHAVDGVGVDGDLAGARWRWDLSARGEGETLAVYRVRQKLDAGSVVLRKLFQYQPSLEYGVNVALGLVWMRAVRGRVEGWGGVPVRRRGRR